MKAVTKAQALLRLASRHRLAGIKTQPGSELVRPFSSILFSRRQPFNPDGTGTQNRQFMTVDNLETLGKLYLCGGSCVVLASLASLARLPKPGSSIEPMKRQPGPFATIKTPAADGQICSLNAEHVSSENQQLLLDLSNKALTIQSEQKMRTLQTALASMSAVGLAALCLNPLTCSAACLLFSPVVMALHMANQSEASEFEHCRLLTPDNLDEINKLLGEATNNERQLPKLESNNISLEILQGETDRLLEITKVQDSIVILAVNTPEKISEIFDLESKVKIKPGN